LENFDYECRGFQVSKGKNFFLHMLILDKNPRLVQLIASRSSKRDIWMV